MDPTGQQRDEVMADSDDGYLLSLGVDSSKKFLGPGYTDRALTDEELERYSRQIIVPGMGKEAQLRLIQGKVLIIGAGGLGCPAAQYVAGAGVGTIGIVDGDVVETSNLHRQVGHSNNRVGMTKVESLISHLQGLNPLPTYVPHITRLTPQNAALIIREYDLVLDCTDNPATRYLISDMCVLLRKPLVSAASVQTSGQLVVLNCPPVPQGLTRWPGIERPFPPCYRCCFPHPPPPSTMTSCGEAGIMGTVVGMMGVAQAGEAIKILAKGHHLKQFLSQDMQKEDFPNFSPSLLLYSYDLEKGPSNVTFRSVKLSGRRKNCFACGDDSPQTLTLQGITNGNPNYEQFCSMPTTNVVLPMEDRISAEEYRKLLDIKAREGADRGRGLLIDTREKEHFSIGAIPGAINLPFGKLLTAAAIIKRELRRDDAVISPDAIAQVRSLLPSEIPFPPTAAAAASSTASGEQEEPPIYVVCRRGLDSQEAVEILREIGFDLGGNRRIVDIIGGMKAWQQQVDRSFPFI